MTLEELCFIAATVLFAVEALPMVGNFTPIKLLPAGLALMAFGFALGAGLAGSLGVTGKVL